MKNGIVLGQYKTKTSCLNNTTLNDGNTCINTRKQSPYNFVTINMWTLLSILWEVEIARVLSNVLNMTYLFFIPNCFHFSLTFYSMVYLEFDDRRGGSGGVILYCIAKKEQKRENAIKAFVSFSRTWNLNKRQNGNNVQMVIL